MRKPGRRTRAVATGAAVVAVYLVSVLVSARLSVLARRPLLDGFTPPPPYRWVKPPEDLAATNVPPEEATVAISLSGTTAGAGVYGTKDMQVNLVLEPNAFQPGTAGPVSLAIRPLDPAPLAPLPSPVTVAGNVYLLEAKAKDGTPVAALRNPGHLVLAYPVPSHEAIGATHALFRSPDGRAWTKLDSQDSPASQQASSDVTQFGYFAVGTTGRPPTAKKKSPLAGLVAGIGAGVVVVGAAIGYGVRRRREAAKRRRRALQRRSPKRGQGGGHSKR